MSTAPLVESVIRDADGTPHTYRVVLHPGSEGAQIMWELYALASGPLAAGLGVIAGIDGSFADLLKLKTQDVLGKLDAEAIGRSVQGALASMPALTGKILRYTYRDDKPLADRSHFDAAFQANYWELTLAVWGVVQANRFLPLSAISSLATPTPRAVTAPA